MFQNYLNEVSSMDFFIFLTIYLVSDMLQVPHASSSWIQIEETQVMGHAILMPEGNSKRVCETFNDTYSFFLELTSLVLLILHHLSKDNSQPRLMSLSCVWKRASSSFCSSRIFFRSLLITPPYATDYSISYTPIAITIITYCNKNKDITIICE